MKPKDLKKLEKMAETNQGLALWLAALKRDERAGDKTSVEKPRTVDRGPVVDYFNFWRDFEIEDPEYDKEVAEIMARPDNA